MTSRDLVIKTLNHQPVDRVPRDLWCLPGVEAAYAEELAELEIRYPKDIVQPDFEYPRGNRAKGDPSQVGQYVDAWGCTWQVTDSQPAGELKESPLAEPGSIAQYQPPLELLSDAKLERVERSCAATSRFVLARTQTRPFDRLLSLRGSKPALTDLAHGTKRIRTLLAMLHDFSCRELEMWAQTDVDGVEFVDTWGSPEGLLISPQIWRDLFRPLYREYCNILHAQDKFAFLRCPGNTSEVFGDLVKIGIDAVDSQFLSMHVERLAKRFRGRVTFWAEIDRQYLLPHGTVEEVREAVLRLRRALDFGSGGVIAQCQWVPGVPMQNVIALFQQWTVPLPMHAT
jgi:uroporphyrinogen decarboxylase